MASDVFLLIFDPQAGAMVRRRWLGRNSTRDRARSVLGPPVERSQTGYECWADVASEDAIRIAEESYLGGAGPDEVRAYAAVFPTPAFWWMVEHDF